MKVMTPDRADSQRDILLLNITLNLIFLLKKNCFKILRNW